jgi:hypothetical protein
MSEQGEQWARQLLEKTKAGKLDWSTVRDQQFDTYRAEIGDGFSFFVQRKVAEDDYKQIFLELKENGRSILADKADNQISSLAKIFSQAESRIILSDKTPAQEYTQESSGHIARFRLFSDLFYAARTKAMGGEQTLKKVQKLIESL